MSGRVIFVKQRFRFLPSVFGISVVGVRKSGRLEGRRDMRERERESLCVSSVFSHIWRYI